MATFRKATKEQAFARIAIYGPAGAGKTLGALRLAKGMAGSIALIDSERGSANKSADHPASQVDFDICELDRLTIVDYVEAINQASKLNYDNLIIDSMSHAWRELIEEVDKLAHQKFGGNTWAAWSKGTPKQRMFVDSILKYPGHVISTMRAKTEWTLSEGSSGKKSPQRVGLAPDQGKGIEYEFDMLIAVSTDHTAFVEKDRTGKFQDYSLDLLTEEFGHAIADWLNKGAPIERIQPSQLADFNRLKDILKLSDVDVGKALQARGLSDINKCTAQQAREIIASLETKANAQAAM